MKLEKLWICTDATSNLDECPKPLSLDPTQETIVKHSSLQKTGLISLR
jgi:hypothetical protein